jgi:hypothetical protein
MAERRLLLCIELQLLLRRSIEFLLCCSQCKLAICCDLYLSSCCCCQVCKPRDLQQEHSGRWLGRTAGKAEQMLKDIDMISAYLQHSIKSQATFLTGNSFVSGCQLLQALVQLSSCSTVRAHCHNCHLQKLL